MNSFISFGVSFPVDYDSMLISLYDDSVDTYEKFIKSYSSNDLDLLDIGTFTFDKFVGYYLYLKLDHVVKDFKSYEKYLKNIIKINKKGAAL